MKSTRKYIVAVCALAIGFAVPVVQAEEGAPTPPKKERVVRADRADVMKEKLGLSDEQAEQIKKIQADTRAQMKALREKELDPKARREEARKIQEGTQAKIEAVLTAEQKAKFAEMRKERRQGPGGPKEGKGPKPDKGDKAPPAAPDSEM